MANSVSLLCKSSSKLKRCCTPLRDHISEQSLASEFLPPLLERAADCSTAIDRSQTTSSISGAASHRATSSLPVRTAHESHEGALLSLEWLALWLWILFSGGVWERPICAARSCRLFVMMMICLGRHIMEEESKWTTKDQLS